ncbi:MAG: energy transducer TonB [Alphaproteobacteria bacterium]|nr:energy transducer TonB [Alphaproteobacteria bacterium]MBU0796642.1 energy transducer TonB [Alphaproteobacteria bacterium]MBU0886529.1 energy transducer TonB [Alphaproteobacteria bacterium]MBU1814117.1 energy transducer TonB [Alphaproteobacteria bacterium]MBU2090992.1 energy transducer TonB [Alphaproteobacteria bacterium]
MSMAFAMDSRSAAFPSQMSTGAKAAALVVSLALHASLLLFFVQPPVSGTPAAGLGGIEVGLGPAGGSPGGAVKAVEATETTKPVDDIAAASPVETAEPVTPVTDAVPPTPVQPTETVKAVEPMKAVEPVIAKPVEATTPREVVPPPPPKPVMAKPVPPKRQVAQTPAPRETPPAETQQAQPGPQASQAKPTEGAKTGESTVTGSAGQSGNSSAPTAGSANNTAGGGMPGSSKDYLAVIQAWLEQHKEYPRRAQLRRMEGTALIRFVMDRGGNLLSFRLERGSGYDLLDDEVKKMVQRASPFPPLPAEMQQAQLELLVPVSFFLR